MACPSREQFTAVALSFLSVLYTAAHRLTGNEHDAQDLVQDTYTEAFRHADQLRDLSHCRAWLFRILRNRFLSLGRQRRGRPELAVVEGGLETAEEAAAADSLPQLERAMIGRLARPAILQALSKLPEEMRTTLLLCDLDGFTYEEIAEILQCPLGTVRSRIARARGQLAKQLAAHAAALGIGRETPS